MRARNLLLQIAPAFVVALASLAAAPTASSAPTQDAPAVSLDFEFFKTRVQPIFLKQRSPDHARCYACHASGTGPQYLVKMSPGSSSWNEAQSRSNFENVSKLVNLDEPLKSRILIHPLSPMAGGDTPVLHGGGRQFESKDDPDWKTIAEWVKGAKVSSSAGR
jgi:hypothetical protein